MSHEQQHHDDDHRARGGIGDSMAPEWTAYRIGFPGSMNREITEGRLLETVYHIAHVPGARRILEDGYLKAGIVYDESKLRKSRIAVTWLSANSWAYGSIYGNVEFSFSWAKQMANKNFYWVEIMPSYRPPAYRILLSDRELNSKYVDPYDPERDKGPLRKRDGIWFWNGDYTSEFLIEGDISLDECTSFNFVTHHDQYCSLHGSSCKDRGHPGGRAAGPVIATILGNDLHSVDHVLKQMGRRDSVELSNAIDVGVDTIIRALGSTDEKFGGAIRAESSRQSVLRGALSLYGAGQLSAARELVAVLKSKDVFETALTEVVNAHFGISDWAISE